MYYERNEPSSILKCGAVYNNQLLQSLKLLVHLFTYLHVDSCIAISVTYCPIILQFFFIMYSTLMLNV